MNRLDLPGIPRRFAALAAAALVLLPAAGCDSVDSPPPPPSSEASTVHLALAGGGWRAHTGHAGWTMSLLDDGEKTLADVFEHVGTVSSNSGGSWFSTMLVYSEDFVTAIEAKNALSTWSDSEASATGWLGQQQYLFDQASCHALDGEYFLACVFAEYTGSAENATYWNEVVEDLVFKDFPVPGLLNGARQPWATSKPLLLAATMLTNEAVLGELDARFHPRRAAAKGPDG